MILSCPSFSAGKRELVANVTLELPAKGVVVVQGPSGCGKTLLLQGLHADAIRQGFRAVLQDQGARTLVKGRSVEYNVGLGMPEVEYNVGLGMPEAECSVGSGIPEDAVCQQEVPISLPFQQKIVGEISGGERRLTCLAQVLSSPDLRDLVCLDEPTNDLDPQSVEWLKGRLREVSQRLLVMMATHDDRMTSLANGMVTMRDGVAMKAEGAVRLCVSPLSDEREGGGCFDGDVPSEKDGGFSGGVSHEKDGGLGGVEASEKSREDDSIRKRTRGQALGERMSGTLMAEWPYFALILLMALVPLFCLQGATSNLSSHEAAFQEGEVDIFSSSSLAGRDRYTQGVAIPLTALSSVLGDGDGFAWSDAVSDESSGNAGMSFQSGDSDGWAMVVADSLSSFSPEVLEWVDTVTRQYYQIPDDIASFQELAERASPENLAPTYMALSSEKGRGGDVGEWELLAELAALSPQLRDADLWVAASVVGEGLAQGEMISRNKTVLGECVLWEALLVALGALVHGLWLYRFRWELVLFRNLGLSAKAAPVKVAKRYLHMAPSLSVAAVGSLSTVVCGSILVPEGLVLGLVTGLLLLVALGLLQVLRLAISVLYSRKVFDWRYR